MPETLDFYTNPMSRGQIVRWALHEVGAEYQEHIIEYGEQMQSDEYRAINPMAKVPAIKHGDRVVTECSAICAYLADAFPVAALAPAPNDRADYYRWLFFAAGPVEAATTNQNLGLEPTEEQERMAGYGNISRTIDALTEMLGSRTYVCGDSFSAADIYLGSQIIWGNMFGSIPNNDVFDAYSARLTSRAAYQQAKAIDQALIDAAQTSAWIGFCFDRRVKT